jgi:hypothetical protein
VLLVVAKDIANADEYGAISALARALVAGVVADALGMPAAIDAVALLTAASAVVVLLRMRETLVGTQ